MMLETIECCAACACLRGICMAWPGLVLGALGATFLAVTGGNIRGLVDTGRSVAGVSGTVGRGAASSVVDTLDTILTVGDAGASGAVDGARSTFDTSVLVGERAADGGVNTFDTILTVGDAGASGAVDTARSVADNTGKIPAVGRGAFQALYSIPSGRSADDGSD